MSSDSTTSSLITLVPLGTSYLHGALISDELYRLIDETIGQKKKIFLLYNRRGSGRAWICQDCGQFPLCPQCDIAFAYHTSPRAQLLCHQCNLVTHLPAECSKCRGISFHPVGFGVQKVAYDLELLFPESHILRLDSDADIVKGHILDHVDDADIIIGTHVHLSLIHHRDIREVGFLLFESDLTFPDYRVEEDTYHIIEYIKKSQKHLLIQTYTENHPLLTLVREGNYKDFLESVSTERKTYQYPPYGEFVVIRIRDLNKDKVQNMMVKMINKITELKDDTVFLAYDREIWEKYAGEWIQKIILKGKDLSLILDTLEVEIVRNRSVTLERR